MATIDYKQKIKDYMNSSEVDTLYKSMLNNLFPELAESEDERIRKRIIQALHGDVLDMEETTKAIAWIEAQVEQKPTDKVEPKFKAGDWVVYKGDVCQIVKREEGCNKLVTVFGVEKELVNERNLSTARIWTIKDAKDGDVLVDNVGVILFRKIGNKKYADAVDYYCAVFKRGGFIIQKGESYCGLSKDKELRPTTLEQRVRFFDTMGDAGYAWDAEKLELKKIEQKTQPTWRPSDEQMEALESATENCAYSEYQDCLRELIGQLKKLRDVKL